MSERIVSGQVQRRQTTQKNVALYPQDVEAVERLQAHHKLDSFSQTVRRAIRDAIDALPTSDAEKESVAA